MTCRVESHGKAIDSLSGELPVVWRGIDWRFDFRFTLCDQLVGVDGISSLTMEIKSLANLVGAPLLSCTISSVAIDNTLTPATWADGSQQHAHFEFDHANTNLDLGGQSSGLFWAVVKGLTTDSPSKRLVMGVTLIKVEEAGANDGEPPAAGDPSYYTAAQCDSKFGGPVVADYPLHIYRVNGVTHVAIDPTGCQEGQILQFRNGSWGRNDGAASIYLYCPEDHTMHAVDLKQTPLGYEIRVALNREYPL